MKTNIEIENKLRDLKHILITKFYVDKIGYFGSYADNEQNENSDLDILVEFSRPVGWGFFSLEKFLEDSLGLKIDLVTKNALKERLKKQILNMVRYV